jgi:hypothetical protein
VRLEFYVLGHKVYKLCSEDCVLFDVAPALGFFRHSSFFLKIDTLRKLLSVALI